MSGVFEGTRFLHPARRGHDSGGSLACCVLARQLSREDQLSRCSVCRRATLRAGRHEKFAPRRRHAPRQALHRRKVAASATRPLTKLHKRFPVLDDFGTLQSELSAEASPARHRKRHLPVEGEQDLRCRVREHWLTVPSQTGYNSCSCCIRPAGARRKSRLVSPPSTLERRSEITLLARQAHACGEPRFARCRCREQPARGSHPDHRRGSWAVRTLPASAAAPVRSRIKPGRNYRYA